MDTQTTQSRDPKQRKPRCGLPTPLSRTYSFNTQPERHHREASLDIPRGLVMCPSFGTPNHRHTDFCHSHYFGLQLGVISKETALLRPNSRFLPAYNLPHSLDTVSLISSPGFLHRSVILREGPHGERSLSPKPNKRIFLEDRDHGLTLFVSFPDSRPVSNIYWVLNRNLLQHLTGKQESRK